MGRQAEISLMSSNNNASQSPEKREQFNLVNNVPGDYEQVVAVRFRDLWRS